MIYKFRIKTLLENLTKQEYSLAMKELPALIGMHSKSFNRLINIKIEENYEPSSDVMVKLASFFNVTVDKLYTTPPNPISIDDIFISSENSAAENLSLIH